MDLSEITMFVLCVAVAGLHALNLLLELLHRVVSPHSTVLVSIAGLFVPLAFATAYNMGVLLVYLQIAPPLAPAVLRRFAALASAIAFALLLLLAAPLVRVLFLDDIEI